VYAFLNVPVRPLPALSGNLAFVNNMPLILLGIVTDSGRPDWYVCTAETFQPPITLSTKPVAPLPTPFPLPKGSSYTHPKDRICGTSSELTVYILLKSLGFWTGGPPAPNPVSAPLFFRCE